MYGCHKLPTHTWPWLTAHRLGTNDVTQHQTISVETGLSPISYISFENIPAYLIKLDHPALSVAIRGEVIFFSDCCRVWFCFLFSLQQTSEETAATSKIGRGKNQAFYLLPL